MNVTGIIAEYNPFHNGHLYQLTEAKMQTNADYVIVAMSGNFTQRGVPAIIDKYARAEMALKNGADLIIEIPSLFASSSAELFAHAGISLFDHCKVVSSISFGCETPSIEKLKDLSLLLSEENALFKSSIQGHLKNGLSYPLARLSALKETLGCDCKDYEIYTDLLSSPNNILALEYLKAIHMRNSNLEPFPIKRQGNDYNQTSLSGIFSSATSIRKNMMEQGTEFLDAIPDSVFESFAAYKKDFGVMDENMLSQMLFYQLLSLQSVGYAHFFDCSKDLSNRISKNLPFYTSFHDFCDLLKSKDITFTRIQRVLLHILLQQTQQDFLFAKGLDYVPYLKILGFRKSASPLLNELKKNADIPMITKLSNAQHLLNPDAFSFFQKNLFADQVYYATQSIHTKKILKGELSRSPVII